MAFQVDQTCYQSVDEAGAAFAAKYNGFMYSNGSTLYRTNVSYNLSQITYKVINVSTGGTVSTQTVAFATGPCGMLDWQDTLALSWMVVAVWVVAFAYRRYRDAAK